MLAGCNDSSRNSSLPKPPSPSELAEQNFASPNLARITAEELKVIYDNKEPVLIVDVRSRPVYIVEGHIPGATNIPNLPPDDSYERLTALPKDRLIVLYCDCMDDGESAIAAEKMTLAGYDNVKILWKGIYYWTSIGGELQK